MGGLLCQNYPERTLRRLSPRELARWDPCPWEVGVVVVVLLQVGPPQLLMLPLLPRKRRKRNRKRRKMMTWDSASSTRSFNLTLLAARRLLFVTNLSHHEINSYNNRFVHLVLWLQKK